MQHTIKIGGDGIVYVNIIGYGDAKVAEEFVAQADKIITLGKKNNLQNTKILISKLQDTKSANKVKKTLAKRYEGRKGGYTRIIKSGYRYGDNAPLAVIEFVDRDVQAKRVDKKKKDTTKKNEETKVVPA